MSPETKPEEQKSDEESFQEIAALLAEGWKFEGNDFKQDQRYELVISKKDENGDDEKKIFHTERAYPDMFDSVGKGRGAA